MALTEMTFARAGRRVAVSVMIPLLAGDPAQIALRIAAARDGSAEVLEEELTMRYESLCDPRLNARQSLDLAFRVGELMRAD